MNQIENRIVSNINGLLMVLVSKGIKKISLPKLVLYINREFNIQMDDNSLIEILSKNSSVASIEDNNVVLGETQPKDEEPDNEIHDKAVEQASENLTSESYKLNNVLKLFENIEVGKEIQAKSILLKESDKDYFIHNGARKANSIYIISELCPKKTVNESYIRCKIKGETLFVDIPLQRYKETKN